MSSVSTEGIRETNREISSAVHILRSVARETSSKCAAIKGYASELKGYNGARVKESIHTIGEKESLVPSTNYAITTYKCYNTFNINTGNVDDVANSLSQRADEVYETVAKILAKVSDINGMAEAIEGYIQQVQSTLGDNISAKALGAAALAIGQEGVAKANLAKSVDDLKKRNYIDYDTFKNDSNFSSGKLSFEPQEDGSYLVFSNGKSTGYYTSGLTAALYLDTMRTIMKSNKEEVPNLSYIHTKDESITKTVKNTISAATDRVSDGIKSIKDKAGVAATAINKALEQAENQKQTANNNGTVQEVYDRFDESSTSYVEEKFGSSDSDTQQFISNVSNYEDYSIPEGKTLYDESSKVIANSGDVLSFDGSNSSYVVKNSSGDLQNSLQYSLDDLAKSSLIEN